MVCLVTGASGYLGSALVPALQGAGVTVRALVNRSAAPVVADDVQRVDLTAQVPTASLEEVSTVFHLAGLAHSDASPAAYRALNVEAVDALARASAAAGVKTFVFLSSAKAALGSAGGSYAESKVEAERRLQALAATTEMNILMLRPALVYGGPVQGYLRWLQRWVRARLPAPPPGGGRPMIARDDLVSLLLQLRSSQQRVAEPLLVHDGQQYSARRLHWALCEAQRRRPWLPSPPLAAWRASAAIGDRLTGRAPGSLWDRLQGEECHGPSLLADCLGFTPGLTFEAVARREAAL